MKRQKMVRWEAFFFYKSGVPNTVYNYLGCRHQVLKWKCEVEVKCDLLPLALWTVWTLISCTDTYACCGRPTQNVIECFELGSLHSNTVKPLHLVSVRHKQQHHITMYTDLCVKLFSMNVNLKMFCILCLCIILCDTSKASENLTFVLKQSLILSSVFVFIICHQANPWRGNLLLLNCAVSQPGDPRPGRTSHEIADSFNKQANKSEQIALNCSIFSK